VLAENGSVGDFTGRVVVVTGASSGVGLAAATEFARRGARVGVVGRDPDRLASAVSAVRGAAAPDAEPTGYQADFGVLDEVRKLAAALLDGYPKIDVLCNNAGGIVHNRQATVDGHELTIQANHLAPFLLTNLLRERLAGGRVVNTSSRVHRGGRIDPDDLDGANGGYRSFAAYGASKQANILFAAEAARRWPDVISTSYHPGIVRSRFGRGSMTMVVFYKAMPFLTTPAGGADTMLWLAAADPSTVDNGAYYVKRQRRQPSPRAADPALAARLWEASAQAVGL
jgi:NAD(P)-dependent dehydrogenase (short-subunit alcohol dehydrogenase family)